MTDTGLVGQVISVNYAFSRVLLLTDNLSAVPVINTRNQVRAIAAGDNGNDELLINNVPRSTDFKVGDTLVTSGLGGVFPEGYPVATVTSVGFSESQPFAFIKAKPAVDSTTMRYVLLLWYHGNGDDEVGLGTPKEATDGKIVLRRDRIKKLIESMSTEEAHIQTEHSEQEKVKDE